MKPFLRPSLTTSSVLILMLWSLCESQPLYAQEKASPAAAQALGQCRLDATRPGPLTLGRKFVGIDRECLLCHSSGNQGGYAGPLSLLEAKIWRESDPHSSAFAVLLSEESKQMGRRLGNATAIERDARCLACHSGFPLHNVPLEAGLVPESLIGDTRNLLQWGISCEACHGAAKASDAGQQPLAGWLESHRDPEWIKKFTASEKQSQFGLYDVRSPVARARMCVSCHIGNAEEGRVVTHEMYAAGHPPLPIFELETCAQQMPAHWKLNSSEQAADAEAKQRAAVETLRAMTIGAAVGWAEQLRLTANMAGGEVAEPASDTRWPELAQFECYACHHELRKENWRLDRQFVSPAGRPLLRGVPSPLFKALLAATGQDTQAFVQQERDVMATITQRPFGAPCTKLVPILLAAADWADAEAERMETENLNLVPRAALVELSKIAAADVYEYDVARQISWAFAKALGSIEPDQVPAEVMTQHKAIARLFLSYLPAARTTVGVDSIANSNREVKLITLSEVLPPIADYDAAEYRRRFTQIRDLLQVEAAPK